MSTHAYPHFPRWPSALALIPTAVAVPSSVMADGTSVTFTFTPDLTPAQAATLDRVIAFTKQDTPISWAERTALDSAVADLRALRTQSATEFSALTAAQRDAALRTALFGCIDVLRALLRD